MKLTFRSMPLFLALLPPLSATLQATVVNPLAGYSFQAICENTQATGACTQTLPYPNGGGSQTTTVQYSLNLPTGPSVTVNTSGSNVIGLNNDGELIYQIMVNGPTPSVQVDVNYLASVSGSYTALGNDETSDLNAGAALTVGPYNVASTQIHVQGFGGSIENNLPTSLVDTSVNAAYSSQTGGWVGSLSGPETLTLTTGIAYNVTLFAQANCIAQNTANSNVGCQVSASVDPTFTIDPSQLNAGQYSFLLSNGVGNGFNVTSAPEPAAALLLIPGALALAVTRKRLRLLR